MRTNDRISKFLLYICDVVGISRIRLKIEVGVIFKYFLKWES